eukprot:4320100-Pyramimonas_sp.AAC.1
MPDRFGASSWGAFGATSHIGQSWGPHAYFCRGCALQRASGCPNHGPMRAPRRPHEGPAHACATP